MEKCIRIIIASAMAPVLMTGCQDLKKESDKVPDSSFVRLEEVAQILSVIPIDHSQMSEVHQAVLSSSCNGYDEEYTMKDLFTTPGAGVGDSETKSSSEDQVPLRDLIEEYVYSSYSTRSLSGQMTPEEFLGALMESDIQIYWPFSEAWDGETMPVITFDPEDGSEVNVGYRLMVDDDGLRKVEEVVVDEVMAADVPVWVVNRNSDAGYSTLEMLRKNDPQWGEGGGNIIIRPQGSMESKAVGKSKALVLRDFTMKRNFDTWFAGASEFFVLTITGGCSFA